MDEETSQTHNRVVRLFTYLEKALALDDNVIRDFRGSILEPSPWWIADYPEDLDNLYIKKSVPEVEDGLGQEGVVLRVQKKDIEKAPSLPEKLQEWVPEVTPIVEPKPKENIDRKIKFINSAQRAELFDDLVKDYFPGKEIPEALDGWITITTDHLPEQIEERYIEDPYVNHPELDILLSKYIENDWHPWAERTIKAYKANLLYDQLYALRLVLKNEGDRYELVLGQGLLTWKRGSDTIYSPIFLTPLVLDFNAITRTILINQDSMLKVFVELTSLQELGLPSEMDLVSWADKINADPFDFWHFETLKRFVLVNSHRQFCQP